MAKKPVQTPEIPPASRGERVMAAWFISLIGVAILAIIALFIARGAASGPIWAVVQLLPLIALPLAIILIVILMVLGGRRRGRAAKGAGK